MPERPGPEQVQPPVGRLGTLARLAGCLAISALVWVAPAGDLSPTELGMAIVAGLISYVVVWFRRRAPMTAATTVLALSAVSGIAVGPAVLVSVSVATRRQTWEVLVVGVLNVVAGLTYSQVLKLDQPSPFWLNLLLNVVFTAAMLGWGLYIGSRREIAWDLRARAERAEAEQHLRVQQARVTERARIAREMHDVLAHRITQVSMHAGALAFRDDLDAGQLRDGLASIQARANEALHELRDVLGVLRPEDAGRRREDPQPTYADIAQMVAEARSTGMHISHVDAVAGDVAVPDPVGRTLYRIVQEGITNAGKHAQGSTLTVRLSGDRERGINVELSNPLGFGTSTPGSRLGLLGLVERAELRGGTLYHGRENGAFVVRGWIPWST